MEAQSWLSVPPAPALISRNALLESASPENKHSTSNNFALASSLAKSFSISVITSLSSSSFASSCRSVKFEYPESISVYLSILDSS